MLFPILRRSSLFCLIVSRCVTQPDKMHANRTASVLEWYDRHREYNIWFKRRRIDKKVHFYKVPSYLIPMPAQTQSIGNELAWQGIEPKNSAAFPNCFSAALTLAYIAALKMERKVSH